MSQTLPSSIAEAVPEAIEQPAPGATEAPAATRRRALLVTAAVVGVGSLAAFAEVDRARAAWWGIEGVGAEGRPCTLRAVLGEHVCPGCGITRSVALTVQGEPGLAVELNPAGPLFVGLGLVTGLLAATALVRGRRFDWESRLGRLMRGTLLIAVAAVGVLRWTGEIG